MAPSCAGWRSPAAIVESVAGSLAGASGEIGVVVAGTVVVVSVAVAVVVVVVVAVVVAVVVVVAGSVSVSVWTSSHPTAGPEVGRVR